MTHPDNRSFLTVKKAIIYAALLLVSHTWALTPSLTMTPSLTPMQPIIPAPPVIGAKAYFLIDYNSNSELAAHAVDERLEPASLTKMMTVYVVDQALKSGKLKLTDRVPISVKAWRTGGSRTFLETGSDASVEELLKGIIIQSGNDASVAISEYVGGSEDAFAELMNFYAKQLGMNNSHFVNATGLPAANHYSSARDMAILGQALVRDFPESYALYSQKWYSHLGIKQMNRNRLLWRNEHVDGIKTGHHDAAGFCLVASGQKDNMRLIAVVLGANSDDERTEQANKLLTYGFRFYETRKLYSSKEPLQTARIWMGAHKEIKLGLKDDLYVTIGQGQDNKLKLSLNIQPALKAPAKKGDILGKVSVKIDDKLIAEQPVIALESIEEAGILSRCYDYLALHFSSLWTGDQA